MSEAALVTADRGAIPRTQPRRLAILPLLCGIVVLAVVVCAIFGEIIAPHNPNDQNLLLGLTVPSGGHWLGTDDLGRDMFSRVLAGARTATIAPALTALGAMIIGNILGVVAGYKGGKTDSLIMRWVDLMFALPGLLVLIVVVGVFGGGYWLAIAVLILLTAPSDTRIVRGATLEQRPLPYVEAARALGLPDRRIMARHIWPNLWPLVVANTFLNFAFTLVTFAGLSFLGLGVSEGTPDWGLMLSENRPLLFQNPAAELAPAGAIIVTAVAINLLGDWLFERLSFRGRAR